MPDEKIQNESAEQGEAKWSPALEAVMKMKDEGMFSGDSKWNDPWLPLMLLLIFGSPKPNNEADYWRGRYDALKEMLEAEKAKQ